MSDEFNGNRLDTSKWASSDPQWEGRKPARFEANSISVADGNLRITGSKKNSPFGGWTHNGGLVRSLNKATYGYYETRMKANKTFLSSTFWLFNKRNEGKGCDVRTTELDITETVGVNTGGQSWINNTIRNMNSNTHSRGTTCASTPVGTKGGKANLGEPSYQNYHTYGVWWKNANELLFYLDDQYKFSIKPPANFNLPMYLRMVVESYNWNPPRNGRDGMNDSFNNRTTYYDWTRSWQLTDDPHGGGGNGGTKDDVSASGISKTLTAADPITISVPYSTIGGRDVVAELWGNSGKQFLGIGRVNNVARGSGTANIRVNLSKVPAAGNNYQIRAALRPRGSQRWQDNIDATTVNNVSVRGSGTTPTPPQPKPKQTVSINAGQDVYFQNTNKYDNRVLRVESSGRTRTAYLRFDLSSVTGNSITNAKLRLVVPSRSNGGDNGSGTLRVHRGQGNQSWTEASILNNTKPSQAALLGSKNGRYDFGSAHEITLDPSLLPSSGTVTLVVSLNSRQDVAFSSREGTAAPQLIITSQ